MSSKAARRSASCCRSTRHAPRRSGAASPPAWTAASGSSSSPMTATAIVGTVQLVLEQPENQPHRADVAKMMVANRARRQGIGAALMQAAEQEAKARGKTLLVLDTASADAERLYARLGWQRCGTVPGYALLPQGGPCDTTYFYRVLGTALGRLRPAWSTDSPRTAQSARDCRDTSQRPLPRSASHVLPRPRHRHAPVALHEGRVPGRVRALRLVRPPRHAART